VRISDIHSGLGADVADHGGERLDVHAVFQRHGGEGVAQVVETYLLALRTLEDLLEFAVDRVGLSRLALLDRRWEHPLAGGGFLMLRKDIQHIGRQNERSYRGFCLWLGDLGLCALLQPYIELLPVVLRELVHRYLADFGDDVVIDSVLVASAMQMIGKRVLGRLRTPFLPVLGRYVTPPLTEASLHTMKTLTDFEGMARILTILARGYLFHDEKGNVLDGKPKDRIELARCALLAWCSIPDSKKATPKEEWQYRTNFREYSGEFPALVDENGGGWFYRHVHGIIDFPLPRGYTSGCHAYTQRCSKRGCSYAHSLLPRQQARGRRLGSPARGEL